MRLMSEAFLQDLKKHDHDSWNEAFPILWKIAFRCAKTASLNLSKTPFYEGKLMGIRGQYLLFEDQTVFNVRSNEGQRIKLGFHS